MVEDALPTPGPSRAAGPSPSQHCSSSASCPRRPERAQGRRRWGVVCNAGLSVALLILLLLVALAVAPGASAAHSAAQAAREQEERGDIKAHRGRKGLLIHHRYRRTAAAAAAGAAESVDGVVAVAPEEEEGRQRRRQEERRERWRQERQRQRRQQEQGQGQGQGQEQEPEPQEVVNAAPVPSAETTTTIEEAVAAAVDAPVDAAPANTTATTDAAAAATTAAVAAPGAEAAEQQQQPATMPVAESQQSPHLQSPAEEDDEEGGAWVDDDTDSGMQEEGEGNVVPHSHYPTVKTDPSWQPTVGVDGDGRVQVPTTTGGGRLPFFGGDPFAFFIAGMALLAIAYHASRRHAFGTGGQTHAALQPEYSPSSPRITYDRATAAAASVAAAQHQQQHRGTPPRLHLEPTYTPQAAAKGRTRSASGAGAVVTSPGSRGAGGGRNNPPPFRLNHHNLAKGADVVVPSAAPDPAHAAPRNMSIYREAPCSACGIQPRTHALVPCSHLVCEGCAATASFCPTCASAVVAKKWVISP